jgi:cyclohexa-1,5-dienecarbonyl-CoA hydratase
MTATAASSTVRVAIEKGIATVTLDRPPLNVLTIAMLGELERAIRELQTDGELRLIVIRGAGRAFSAGVDVGEHLGDSLGPMLDAFARVATALIDSEVPTLSVVQGAALGGACEIVALCDLAIAADDAKLGTPEITLGVVPPVGAAVFSALVGLQRANALVLTGEPVSGAEAAAWGLVWRSVPLHRLEDEVRAIAEKFAGRSAASLRLAKRTIRVSARAALGAAVAAANDEQLRSVPRIADAQEGLRAFVEKRPPRWLHR